MQCVHVIRAAASTPDDKLTGSVKAAPQTGLSSRRQDAGSGRGARLVSSASSARCFAPSPRPLVTATTSDGVHNSALDGCFDFRLCDTSVACHVASSASRARPGANVAVVALLVFTNRVDVVRVVLGVRRPLEVPGAPVQLVPRAINPHSAPQMCRLEKVSALY